jgi:hypothetical protein
METLKSGEFEVNFRKLVSGADLVYSKPAQRSGTKPSTLAGNSKR